MATSAKGSVLIVEDDHDIRVALRTVLEDHGYTVLTAAHGRGALAMLRALAEKPGLVFVDLMMPVMDGWQLVDELHHSPTLAGIPFVVQSAYTNQGSPPGAVATLMKPVNVERLLKLVEQYCSAPTAAEL